MYVRCLGTLGGSDGCFNVSGSIPCFIQNIPRFQDRLSIAKSDMSLKSTHFVHGGHRSAITLLTLAAMVTTPLKPKRLFDLAFYCTSCTKAILHCGPTPTWCGWTTHYPLCQMFMTRKNRWEGIYGQLAIAQSVPDEVLRPGLRMRIM